MPKKKQKPTRAKAKARSRAKSSPKSSPVSGAGVSGAGLSGAGASGAGASGVPGAENGKLDDAGQQGTTVAAIDLPQNPAAETPGVGTPAEGQAPGEVSDGADNASDANQSRDAKSKTRLVAKATTQGTTKAAAAKKNAPVKKTVGKKSRAVVQPKLPSKKKAKRASQKTTDIFRWTKARLKLLGTMPDGKLAEKLNLGATTVFKKRRELNIASFGDSPAKARLRWTAKLVKRLGKVSDETLAKDLGVSVSTVTTHRKRLGIPSIRQVKGQKLGRAPRQWKKSELALLGKHPDAWVAKKLGMGRRHVYAKRLDLGIASMTEQQTAEIWTRQRLKRLGKVPDRQVAQEIGMSIASVAARRKQLGIAAHREKTPLVKKKKPLKKKK